jgi:hypothetical protein
MITSPKLFALASVGVLLLGGGTALLACEGPEGPPGATVYVEAGATQGQPGPAGPVGPSGLASVADGGILTASCMLPCHGFKGVVEQWKTSTHYFGAIANTDEVPSWTGPGACGNCHSGDGLEQRLAGNVGVAAGSSAPTGLASGQINYKKGATTGEITYAGQSKVAIISCITCHDITAANDPHVTGASYTPGSFKMRVKTGPNDEMLIEKSSDAGVVDGTPAGKWGVSNTCIACHKSRKDVTNYILPGASISITSSTWGPHEAPQSDIFSGKGGYHYAGKTFKNSTHQTVSGCSSCHMVKVAANGNIPDHSMRPTVATCAAAGCHANVTSFDVSGGQGIVKGQLAELQGLLAGLNLLTRSTAAPYVPITAGELADKRFELDKTMPGNTITDLQAGALYNYLLIARGSGWGVHNPTYTKQLLWDSISQLKPGNLPPAGAPTRP